MLLLSVLFHAVIFSSVLFIQESMPFRRPFEGIVYEVNLVEMPPAAGPKSVKAPPSGPPKPLKASAKAKVKRKTSAQEQAPTPRIQAAPKAAKPLVVAKRTVETPAPKTPKPQVSPSHLIEDAISRIERKVRTEEKDSHVDRAIAELKSRVRGSVPGGYQSGGAPDGISLRIYEMEVEDRIKSNWSYPVAMGESKGLEAVVLIAVSKDGTILKTEVKRKSSNVIFDQSVLKAVERSDPLPPFPEGYRKSYEEIEINFNLTELENR
jgi:colicin import membrane protein